MENSATTDSLKEKVFLAARPIMKARHPNMAFKRDALKRAP